MVISAGRDLPGVLHMVMAAPIAWLWSRKVIVAIMVFRRIKTRVWETHAPTQAGESLYNLCCLWAMRCHVNTFSS